MIRRDNGKWSNAEEDRINVVPYRTTWPDMFENEGTAIRKAVPEGIPCTPVHVGSTAVPGLAAKPIIDIMLRVPDRSHWRSLIRPLETLGYVMWVDNPHPDRLFFVKGMPPYGTARTHHVHVREQDEIEDAVFFRNYLRKHPEEAAEYAALKRRLAAFLETDREAYTAAKSHFVEDILRRARRL